MHGCNVRHVRLPILRVFKIDSVSALDRFDFMYRPLVLGRWQAPGSFVASCAMVSGVVPCCAYDSDRFQGEIWIGQLAEVLANVGRDAEYVGADPHDERDCPLSCQWERCRPSS